MNDYIKLVEKLVSENKTTGPNQSESLIHYTKMNLQRMNRWMKTGEILPETKTIVEKINSPQKWIVLTEAWCGDAAHSMPFIFKMTELNRLITFEWKLRDENLDLMDQYLTNGGRSIPKLIAYDQHGKERFNWGPRPAFMQTEFYRQREAGVPGDEIKTWLQKAYNEDKGRTLQQEICSLIIR